ATFIGTGNTYISETIGSSSYTVTADSITATPGHCAQWSATAHTLVDAGAACGTVTNAIQNQSTLQAGATAYPDFAQIGTSLTVSGQSVFNGTMTVKNIGGFTLTNSSMTILGATSNPYSAIVS